MGNVLITSGLSKRYKKQMAVDRVDMHIEQNHHVGVFVIFITHLS